MKEACHTFRSVFGVRHVALRVGREQGEREKLPPSETRFPCSECSEGAHPKIKQKEGENTLARTPSEMKPEEEGEVGVSSMQGKLLFSQVDE